MDNEIKTLKLTREIGTELRMLVGGIEATILFTRFNSRRGVYMEIKAPLEFRFIRGNAKVVKV